MSGPGRGVRPGPREQHPHIGFGKGAILLPRRTAGPVEASVALSAVTARFPNARLAADPVYKANLDPARDVDAIRGDLGHLVVESALDQPLTSTKIAICRYGSSACGFCWWARAASARRSGRSRHDVIFFEQIVVCDYDGLGRRRRSRRSATPGSAPPRSTPRSAAAVAELVRQHGITHVMNAVDPRFVMPIFNGALAGGADYLDMAMSLSHRHPDKPYELTGGQAR